MNVGKSVRSASPLTSPSSFIAVPLSCRVFSRLLCPFLALLCLERKRRAHGKVDHRSGFLGWNAPLTDLALGCKSQFCILHSTSRLAIMVYQYCSVFALLLMVVALGVESNCDESTSHSIHGYTFKQPWVVGGAAFTVESSQGGGEESSEAGALSSGSSSYAVTFPSATTAMSATQSGMEQPAPTGSFPSSPAPAGTEPVVEIDSESTSNSQWNDSSDSALDTILVSSTSAPTASSPEFNASRSSDSTSASGESAGPTASETNSDGEASIAQAGSDSSTFQSLPSAVCSQEEVDNVYTLYSNCRSAFDLCVLASDYHIFPYQGRHPTQDQIQGMAESDACVAVFIVVIESNFSACTIGGMPLVSAVETLLKISVDLGTALLLSKRG